MDPGASIPEDGNDDGSASTPDSGDDGSASTPDDGTPGKRSDACVTWADDATRRRGYGSLHKEKTGTGFVIQITWAAATWKSLSVMFAGWELLMSAFNWWVYQTC